MNKEMKLLKAYEWLRENHKKYPNGTSVDIIMTAYAKYYRHYFTQLQTLDKPSIVEKLKRNKELAINEINQSSSGEFYVTKKGYKCYLHHKVVDLKYNRKQTIYYFALNKKEKDYLNINDLPKGKKIVESPKTGLPYVKSIR